MTGIRYVTGDATLPEGDGTKFIAHICNDMGGWGRGFVLALNRRSPAPMQAYRDWAFRGEWEGAPFELGQIQRADFTDPDTHVINMIAQKGIRHSSRAPRAVDYAALRGCFDKLGAEATRWNEVSGVVPSIHMPRIGCGLGGGEWGIVEEAILACLVDVYGLTVTVYDLPPQKDAA